MVANVFPLMSANVPWNIVVIIASIASQLVMLLRPISMAIINVHMIVNLLSVPLIVLMFLAWKLMDVWILSTSVNIVKDNSSLHLCLDVYIVSIFEKFWRLLRALANVFWILLQLRVIPFARVPKRRNTVNYKVNRFKWIVAVALLAIPIWLIMNVFWLYWRNSRNMIIEV